MKIVYLRPYIGITGVRTAEEVKALIDCFHTDGHRLLMIGVLASQKTLNGLANKWPHRYPKTEDISRIFIGDSRCLNLIHYSTDDLENLTRQLRRLESHGGRHLQGIQLNIKWPDANAVGIYKELAPQQRIVLQVGAAAMAKHQNEPDRIAKALTKYRGKIDSILIDPSGGNGQMFDIEQTLAILRAVRRARPELGLGVAGGLSCRTLAAIEPILREFPDISIDAEGKLRDADGRLDLAAAKAYIQIAKLMFTA